MLRATNLKFRVRYFLSSLFPLYLLILLFGIVAKVESKNWNLKSINCQLTEYKCVILVIIFLVIISFISLWQVNAMINETSNRSAPYKYRAKILGKYNQGFREFLLSTIIPLAFTISIEEKPITDLIMIMVFQVIIFEFFQNSSDIFPNLSLAIAGYTLFQAQLLDQKHERYILVFGKTKDINKLLFTDIEFIYFQDSDFKNKNIGIITT